MANDAASEGAWPWTAVEASPEYAKASAGVFAHVDHPRTLRTLVMPPTH